MFETHKQLDTSWVGQSVSWGTMREEDLIPKFEAVIDSVEEGLYDRPEAVDKLLNEDGPRLTDQEWYEVADYLNETLWNLMQEIAPKGTYFGSSEGDGSDYGFWSCEDEEDEYEPDHIRTWTDPDEHGFRLEIWDTYTTSYGKPVLRYEFYHNDQLVFTGADYSPGAAMTIDSDASVAGLLSFLSLKPGDTDSKYFQDYTPEQLTFCQQYGDLLSYYVEMLEHPH